MPKQKHLYDLKRGDTLSEFTGRSPKEREIITFDHVDGMYSYNTLPDGKVIHIANVAPIRKVGKHWRLIWLK